MVLFENAQKFRSDDTDCYLTSWKMDAEMFLSSVGWYSWSFVFII